VIVGIGTDIVQVSRMTSNLAQYGDRFAERILASSEYLSFKQHNQPDHFLAKRFAAKEATAKAFGSGFNHGLSLRHIVVVNEESGRPTLQFDEFALTLAQQLKISRSFVSLSDELDYAVAFVVLESDT
jgi:holo-[acyl-carrier protein] synthase